VRRPTSTWDHFENGLRGSTLLVTPRVPFLGWLLDWGLYGVEYHHVHHLHPRLPAWRQRACHEAGARFFADVPRITLGGAMRATSLTLYDEARGQLVRFDAQR
jgi:omega-6 fatty acid desaturase (delta-12 desaturase)